MKTQISLEHATGKIAYNMTNDYMFRYILQKNQKVLKGLISSLLHLHLEDIKEIKITNPVNLAEDITGKDFVMDINIWMNNNTKINLEMQVTNRHNWTDRSLSYVCRSFDQLSRGSEYEETLPVIHIGFLDFTLFPEWPEFYAQHLFLNVKNHHVYSDKIKISVVDLTQIELATEEDKAYEIDYWARLFKAKSWEEIKMLAQKNECMQEAANSIYIANADEMVRQKCLAREEAERHERTLLRDIKVLKEEKAQLENKYTKLEDKKTQLENKYTKLEDKNTQLENKNTELEDENALLKEELARLKAQLQIK